MATNRLLKIAGAGALLVSALGVPWFWSTPSATKRELAPVSSSEGLSGGGSKSLPGDGRAPSVAEDESGFRPDSVRDMAKVSKHRGTALSPSRMDTAVDVAPMSLTLALDLAQSVPLSKRLATLQALGYDLDRADWESMRDFLLKNDVSSELNPAQLRYLKNEVMAALLRGEAWLPELVEGLRAIFLDSKQDDGVRDYAVQFMAEAATKDARVGWDFHWRVLGHKNNDFAATASLHLLHAAGRGELKPVELEKLASVALRMAGDTSLSAANRATAFSVCSGLSVAPAREIAARVMRDANQPIIARLAAIATVGKLGGDVATRDHLVALAQADNASLKVAAENALLKYRLGG